MKDDGFGDLNLNDNTTQYDPSRDKTLMVLKEEL